VGAGPPGDVTVAERRPALRGGAHDLFVDSNTRRCWCARRPPGDYVVETKVRLTGLPDEGCCFNFAQGGLVIYGDDDNFIKLSSASIWETRQTEFAKELSDVQPGQNRYGNTVVGPPGEDWTYLRIVVERLTARSSRRPAETPSATPRTPARTAGRGCVVACGRTAWARTPGSA
jgi:arabinan endo-1,5-alpha-L-arabinosidase